MGIYSLKKEAIGEVGMFRSIKRSRICDGMANRAKTLSIADLAIIPGRGPLSS